MGSYTAPSRSVVSVNVVCVCGVCQCGQGAGHRTKVKSRRYDGELHYSIKKCGECQCGVCLWCVSVWGQEPVTGQR